MDRTLLPSASVERVSATSLRRRIVRAGLVSALCAVLGAGFVAGPHAAAHPTASQAASHVIAYAVTSDTTIGGPGSA